MMHSRRGVTLIELLIVIAIIALMAGVVTVALHVTKTGTPDDRDRVGAAKREAIQHGQPVRILLHGSEHARMVTALPDGRVIGFPGASPDSATEERNDTSH